jgi:hypothetical protein
MGHHLDEMGKFRWKEAVRKSYAEQLEKVKKEPTRRDEYHNLNLQSSDWRLWNSVEVLDITLSFIPDFLREARRRRKHQVDDKLRKTQQLIDEALKHLCPMGWKQPKKIFGNITLHKDELKKACDLLWKSLQIWDSIYLDVSVELEAKKRGPWTVVTPIIWKQLRNAIYGLEKYLADEERLNAPNPVPPYPGKIE